MKKYLLLMFLLMLPTVCLASETAITTFGEPQYVTQTVTNLEFPYVEGTQNSACAWTLVRGSDMDTTYAKRWYLTYPNGALDLLYAYSASPGTDYGYIDKDINPDPKLTRRLYIPDGIYLHTTFTTVDEGTTAPTISVYFESEK